VNIGVGKIAIKYSEQKTPPEFPEKQFLLQHFRYNNGLSFRIIYHFWCINFSRWKEKWS